MQNNSLPWFHISVKTMNLMYNFCRAFEVGAARPSPGSIGKLRISSEMRTKLEMVTANHSLRLVHLENKKIIK